MTIKKKIFVEKVKLDKRGQFLSSNLILATKAQISKFKSKPCNHDLNVDKLIYDEPGWPYDLRFCAVCNSFISII